MNKRINQSVNRCKSITQSFNYSIIQSLNHTLARSAKTQNRLKQQQLNDARSQRWGTLPSNRSYAPSPRLVPQQHIVP